MRNAPNLPFPTPAAGRLSYLSQAEACLTAATTSADPAARALHAEECKLWLMLAQQRSEIDAVLQRYLQAA